MKTAYTNGKILNGHEDMAPVTGGVDGCQCARTLKLIERGARPGSPLVGELPAKPGEGGT